MNVPHLPTAQKIATNVTLVVMARLAILVLLPTVGAGLTGAAYLLNAKLDTLTTAQSRIEIGQALMGGDIKSLTTTMQFTKEARDRSVAAIEDRLRYLERRR